MLRDRSRDLYSFGMKISTSTAFAVGNVRTNSGLFKILRLRVRSPNERDRQ